MFDSDGGDVYLPVCLLLRSPYTLGGYDIMGSTIRRRRGKEGYSRW
jgi:hypothetical protein